MDAALYLEDFEVRGRWLRIASWRNNYDELPDPPVVIDLLKQRTVADIFTFSQRLPNTTARYSYNLEWDNVAAIPIRTYEEWWDHQIDKKVRKHVRRAVRAGVVVRQAEFSDELVRGIMHIYNESPVRGGRAFRHYGDDFETCKRKHATWLDRSEFIGAFLDGQLVGFVKLVYAGVTARTIQNIAMKKYGTLGVGNALLAKAVELCAQRHICYLIYGKMKYGNKGSQGLEQFKLDNGFELYKLPKYYVPLTAKGEVAIKLGLHRDVDRLIPRWFFRLYRRIRCTYYEFRYGTSATDGGMDGV